MNMEARIGHNSPGPVGIGKETLAEASKWLSENPVIQDEDTAREAAKMEQRVKIAFDEIEAERDSKVRPLNDQVKSINTEYKATTAPLKTARDTINERLTAFARAEQARREAQARRLAAAAAEAERIAREAEAREREAKDNAAQGEVGVDVVTATVEADQAFSRFERADHAANIAERDSRFRVKGITGRVKTLRNVEVLNVEDAAKALQTMGLTANLREAFLSEARAYRKTTGKLPEGITATTEQRM